MAREPQVEEHNETYVESEKLLRQLRAALAEEVATLEAARQVSMRRRKRKRRRRRRRRRRGATPSPLTSTPKPAP